MDSVVELYLAMRSGISRMVAGMVPPDEVEDIVQETYIRLRRAVMSQEIRHPKSYLFRTARNLALDSIKKAANARSTEWSETADYAATPNDPVLDEVDNSESLSRLCDSVDRLPSRAQRVFILKKCYGYTQREIARELGISENTVESHVALGIKRCTEFMEDSGGV